MDATVVGLTFSPTPQRLLHHFYRRDQPAPAGLDDDKPVELLARGDYRRIGQLIAELEYPGVS